MSLLNSTTEKLLGKDTLLSFLSGIFSNIPISLLFAAPQYGTDFWAHVYFYCWLSAIVFSITLTIFSFSLTIKVIEIEKEIEQGMGSEGKALLKKAQLESNGKYLKRRMVGFFVFAILTVCSATAMATIVIMGLN